MCMAVRALILARRSAIASQVSFTAATDGVSGETIVSTRALPSSSAMRPVAIGWTSLAQGPLTR